MQTVFRKIEYLLIAITLFAAMFQGFPVHASNVSESEVVSSIDVINQSEKKTLDVYVTVTAEDMQPYK